MKTQPELFGLATARESSMLIIQAVPWDVTTSYGSGTSRGPETILAASPQLDLYDIDLKDQYKVGYHLEPIDTQLLAENDRLKILANKALKEWDEFALPSAKVQPHVQEWLDDINNGCSEMVKKVYERTTQVLKEKKIPALIGGDHSTPLGAIQAVSELYAGDYGILHIDAHADLRKAYQGYNHSHASIIYNVMQLEKAPQKLVQIGIRDFCQEEMQRILTSEGRIETFFDEHLQSRLLEGETWSDICREVISKLPQKVYVTFDIDGLSPVFCPHTGTPVPGGLSFNQAVFLIKSLVLSGRKIIGFDLNEVAPGPNGDEWDGNVGARMLFKLCGWTTWSQKN